MLISFILLLSLVQTDAHEAQQRDWNSSYDDLHADWETRNAVAIAAVDTCSDVVNCLLVEERHRSDLGSDGRTALGDRILAFGPAGRSALVDLAIDERSNFAINALTQAESWTYEEVDRLIAAIGSDPANRLTRLLASTGDPRAEAVILQLLFSSDESYSDLTKAAATLVASRWRDMLNEWERRLAAGMDPWAVEYVFRRADPGATTVLEIAAETANDRRRSRRLVAVMALSEMGETAIAAEPILVRLAGDPDAEIAGIARSGLMMMGNTQFAVQIAIERCQTVEDDFSPYGNPQGSIMGSCPWNYFETSPLATEAAGPILLRLLESTHPFQREYVSRALTENRYQPAIPVYRAMLRSESWRDVERAIDALVEFEDAASVSDLRSISISHWHPAIRLLAANAANQIEDVAGWVVPDVLLGRVGDSAAYALQTECPGRLWSWRGEQLPHIVPQTGSPKDGESWIEERRLDLANGYLIGTYEGEWLGELVWHPHHDEPEALLADGVLALLPYRDGALVFTGSAHLMSNRGAVFRIEISASGLPRVYRVAELPNAPYGGAVHVQDRLYAVSGASADDTTDYVTVFDAEIGILGLADCVTD